MCVAHGRHSFDDNELNAEFSWLDPDSGCWHARRLGRRHDLFAGGRLSGRRVTSYYDLEVREDDERPFEENPNSLTSAEHLSKAASQSNQVF